MKRSKVGIMAVAFLLVVTGIGFGIAQAEGTITDRPVLSFEDQEALEQGSSSSSQEVPHWANSPAEDTQMQNPTETGSLHAESQADSSTVEIDGILFLRDHGKLYGPP
jgi:hypothetical protein